MRRLSFLHPVAEEKQFVLPHGYNLICFYRAFFAKVSASITTILATINTELRRYHVKMSFKQKDFDNDDRPFSQQPLQPLANGSAGRKHVALSSSRNGSVASATSSATKAVQNVMVAEIQTSTTTTAVVIDIGNPALPPVERLPYFHAYEYDTLPATLPAETQLLSSSHSNNVEAAVSAQHNIENNSKCQSQPMTLAMQVRRASSQLRGRLSGSRRSRTEEELLSELDPEDEKWFRWVQRQAGSMRLSDLVDRRMFKSILQLEEVGCSFN